MKLVTKMFRLFAKDTDKIFMKTFQKEVAPESCSAALQNPVTIHSYIHTHTYACRNTSTHSQIHINTYINAHKHIHTYTHSYIHKCT